MRKIFIEKKIKLGIFLFLVFQYTGFSQSINTLTRYIYLANDSISVKARVHEKNPSFPVSFDHYYTWYAFNELHTTRGSYDGKLLSGRYMEFYLDNNLKQEGIFEKGKKNGKWMIWYPEGRLKEISKWKNSLRNGTTYRYNELGILISAENYKNNRLHGKSIAYSDNKIVAERRFKNGTEIISKPKKASKRGALLTDTFAAPNIDSLQIRPDSVTAASKREKPVVAKKKILQITPEEINKQVKSEAKKENSEAENKLVKRPVNEYPLKSVTIDSTYKTDSKPAVKQILFRKRKKLDF